MTTNPSTGLPEELETLIQPCTRSWHHHKNVCRQCIDEDLTRRTVKLVLDWACRKVCVGCRAGIPVEWFAGHQYVSNFGPVDDVFLHHNEDGYADCAASVLREGK